MNSPEDCFARSVPHERRKVLGQFFTPPSIAEAMVRWVCANAPVTLLDPAVGPGIFLHELSLREPESVRSVSAFDIDPVAINLARERINREARYSFRFVHTDFLSAEFHRERFDAIVANPPYIRHHDAKLPDSVFRAFEREHCVRLSRLTNTYCLFLLKIMRLLSLRGRAIVLTPTEFLNADFGRAIKQALLDSPAFLGFVIFDYKSSIFDGLMTTATLTLFDAAECRDEVRFAHIRGADELTTCLEGFGRPAGSPARSRGPNEGSGGATRSTMVKFPRVRLEPAKKWGTSLDLAGDNGGASRAVKRGRARPDLWISSADGSPRLAAKQPLAPLRPLSEFARCMRGIATGANNFFTLTQLEVERWRLPAGVLSPCITKAAHAPGLEFTKADYRRLLVSGRRAQLLTVTPRNAHLASDYLKHGEKLGIQRRYLTRHRDPWYITEHREPADIWVTVFGRKRLRFVRNTAGIVSLTTFHAIYLAEPYRQFIPLLMDYFQTEEFAQHSAAEHRVYGDGLLKFEPRDVGRLLIPDLDLIAHIEGRRRADMLF